MYTVGRMKLQSFLNYCSSTSLLILFIENYILSVYTTILQTVCLLMVSHDHEEQAKSRPAEAALIADPRAIDILYVSNSLF